jgi:hypothetical protein
MSALQRKEPVPSTRFPAAELHDSWSPSAAVRVSQHRTHSGKPGTDGQWKWDRVFLGHTCITHAILSPARRACSRCDPRLSERSGQAFDFTSKGLHVVVAHATKVCTSPRRAHTSAADTALVLPT